MGQRLGDLPHDVRTRTAAAIRDRAGDLAEDALELFAAEPRLDTAVPRESAAVLLACLAVAIEDGTLDSRHPVMSGFSRVSPALTMRVFMDALQRTERVVLDELAVHDGLGATSESWPVVAQAVRTAVLEVIAVFAERDGGHAALRDQLTTLFARPVFDTVLAQEICRAERRRHGVVMLLFDVDRMSQLNSTAGHGTGDLLLERLGFLARHFFRTHDWVARHGADSIAVLLPGATLDQAGTLATRFRQMVGQRLVLTDHHTGAATTISVSGAVVGTEAVHGEIDARRMLAEAEAAVGRARSAGGNRIERVALLPTSLTIIGAAALLGCTPHHVVRLLRTGALRGGRRGRHVHIHRDAIEAYRAVQT